MRCVALVCPTPVVESNTVGQLDSSSKNSSRKAAEHISSKPLNDSFNQGSLNVVIVSRDCFIASKPSCDAHARTVGFTGFYGEAFKLQSELVLHYLVEAFATLGSNFTSMPAGNEVATIPLDLRHKKLIPQFYKLLADGGLVGKGADGIFRRTQTPVPTVPASVLHQRRAWPRPSPRQVWDRSLHAAGYKWTDWNANTSPSQKSSASRSSVCSWGVWRRRR
ncbi:hypothetical protein HD806DRAFT_186183 [Xylariaceae sp. AK1471]|nr:hypothetical protein HD806DRAFT_186183 [Xylariaceae sp. AK1471]